jgi:cell division protease FtsH
MNIGESDLANRLAFILAGRAAEKLVFGEFSAGAENDLMQATRLARKMVSNWGMSERVGPLSCQTSNEHPFLGRDVYEQRDFSEHTAQVVDEEVTRILGAAADRAMDLLRENRDKLDTLSNELESREMLDDNEVEQVIGPAVPRSAESCPSATEG